MKRTVFGLILLMLSGCASRPVVRFSPLDTSVRRPARTVDQVEVFITTKPEKKYAEMGVLSYLTYRYNPDDRSIITLLRDKAAEIGADAIIMLETRTETATNYTTKQTYQGKVFRAMAITYSK